MNAKLTLTIEQSIIEKAKKIAKKQKHSLSGLIENYLLALTKESVKDGEDIVLTPIVKSLKSSYKAQKDLDYKKELSEQLTEKYL
ncbi:MAG: DUF6364 family protein [Dysgonamonadaceae bacterium]|jgi:hypothetical protein|nr:DUF6364 family protein [Dysgonamonadaceae bacterium]